MNRFLLRTVSMDRAAGGMSGMRRWAWAWGRRLAGCAVLAVLLWLLGPGPFVAGVRQIDLGALLAALSITLLTTVCSAWRWRTVARGLGADLSLRAAVPACYRSQFINSALPGGVVGDVHRGVRQGLDAGDVGRGLRAVAWERAAGQVVLVAVSLSVLLVLDSPVHDRMGWIGGATVGAALCVVLAARALARRGPSRWGRVARATTADVRDGLLARRAWPVVTASSVLVAGGHAGVFLVAARTTGSEASLVRLLPLALLVLLAMALPLNVGGWGPREGMAAWAFGAAGLGAGQGVAAATAFGVLALVAVLPGALVLAAEWFRSGAGVQRLRIRRAAAREPVEARA
jgi:glycosyltransferase 2 family protein